MMTRKTRKSDIVWGGAAAGLIGYEVAAIRREDLESTLSPFARRVFWTHTTPGRVIFLMGWYGFAGWFGYHIALEGLRNHGSD